MKCVIGPLSHSPPLLYPINHKLFLPDTNQIMGQQSFSTSTGQTRIQVLISYFKSCSKHAFTSPNPYSVSVKKIDRFINHNT